MFNSKMTLQFKIDRQHITRLDNYIVTEKSNDYLYAHFVFSDDWNGLDKQILIRPLDVDSAYRLELDSTNTCRIPNTLILFPGFVISARGEGNSVINIVDGIAVDVELALIESGGDIPIAHITSSNNTINIAQTEDTVDIGIDLSFNYNRNNSTLTLNANTLDEQVIELSSVQLDPSVSSVVAEDRYESGGSIYYRNLVFTFTDGSVQRVSLDSFWNETRQALNSLSSRITTIENDYLTSADKTELQNAINSISGDLSSHINDTNNPHNVTKEQVGLGNVDNTSDLDKPISTATQAALDLKANQTDLNSVSERVSTIEQDYLTSSDKTALEQEISGVAGDLSNEITNRENADTALSGRISALENEGYITQDINTSSISVQYTKSKSKIALVGNSEWDSYTIPTNALQLSSAYGNEYFISCGENGSVIYSQDGENWTLLNVIFSSTDLNKIVYGNGYFLTISFETKQIYKAYTPNVWTTLTTLTNIVPTNLQYVNNQFIITGEDGKIAVSVDGKKFKVIDTGVLQTINSIAYGNSVYVALGNNGTILYSKNLIDWYNRSDNSFTENYKNVIFYNGIFVATTNQKIRYSTNYYQFFNATIPSLDGGYIIQDIIKGESNYYAIANNGTNSKVLKSTNGQVFTLDYSPNSAIFTICYGIDNYVVLGDDSLEYNLNLTISWSFTRPTLADDEYLWGRSVNYLNNGDVLYSAAYFIFTPKTLSDFQNDMGYIDSSVDDLENYYDIPTTDDLLDTKQDDMVSIENNEINTLFS